jgi:hypothetical protein
MGYLTAFLQAEFTRQLPQGWSCRSEVQVLPKELVNVLGYSSIAVSGRVRDTSTQEAIEINRLE